MVPQVEVFAPVEEFTKTAADSVPSMPSQLLSMLSPAGSAAPGKIELSASLQSEGTNTPSPSPSPFTVMVRESVSDAPLLSVTVRTAVKAPAVG